MLGVSYGATVAVHADRSGIRSPVVFEPPLFAGGSALGDVPARYRALLEEEALAAAARLFAAESRAPARLLDALGSSLRSTRCTRIRPARLFHLEAAAWVRR